MANGFPSGNFRIVNKESGACIASQHGGYTHGLQDAMTALGEKGVLPYTHTNDRLLAVHDKVKNIEEELWYFESTNGLLYSKVKDIRSNWVLCANVKTEEIGSKWKDHDLENFLSLLPKQDEETLAHLRTSNYLDITQLLNTNTHLNTHLKIFKTEKFQELQETLRVECEKIEEPIEEAKKIIQKLKNYLDSHTFENNFNTAKKIWQTGLKSNESFEQLQTALKNTTDKEKQAVHSHSGNVFLQDAGRKYQTYWTFEDGYIFVKGQPDAVLTHSSDSSVSISHRSNDPRQHWELKSA